MLLGPEAVESVGQGISQADMAIVAVLEAVLGLLVKKKIIVPSELDSFFSKTLSLYLAHRLKDAAKVLNALQRSVTSESFPTEQEVIHKLLEIAPLGSA